MDLSKELEILKSKQKKVNEARETLEAKEKFKAYDKKWKAIYKELTDVFEEQKSLNKALKPYMKFGIRPIRIHKANKDCEYYLQLGVKHWQIHMHRLSSKYTVAAWNSPRYLQTDTLVKVVTHDKNNIYYEVDLERIYAFIDMWSDIRKDVYSQLEYWKAKAIHDANYNMDFTLERLEEAM